jgi:hypothetical protein
MLAVGAEHAFLDRGVPIADTAKTADFFPQGAGVSDDVIVTLESIAKATPVDMSNVAAAESVAMRMGSTPP